MALLLHWLRNLFVPTITHVKVVLYENGKEKDISVYDANRRSDLIASINILWKVPEKSPCSFETEIVEHRYCFQRPIMKMRVTCYREDVFKNGFKEKSAIPLRYRKKMIGQTHCIYPVGFGKQPWFKDMAVRFRIEE
jgi:hypothetical protein